MNAGPGTTANSRLRHARELRGWSQKHVADAIGTSKFMISRWEGGVTVPSPHFREQLCVLFGKTAEELGFISSLPSDQTQDQEPAEPPLIWHVPLRRNSFFTGREAALAQLQTGLQTSRIAAFSQAISGLGGIGKTSLALEYAYRYRTQYQAILWAGADSREHLLSSLAGLTEVLGLPEEHDADQGRAVAAVQRWLQGHSNWLLIVDNLEDLGMAEEVLPFGPGHLLVTTRAHPTGFVASRLDLAPLVQEEGTLLLLRRARLLPIDALLSQASTEAREWAEAITTHLDGLPLALDQAGAYVEETNCGLEGYLRRLITHKGALLKRRGQMIAGHPESVTTTLLLNIARVRIACPEAAELLECCAFLHPDAIPEELFTQGNDELGPRLAAACADPLTLDTALTSLGHFSLLRRDPYTRTLYLHRVVQAVLQEEMSDLERKERQQQLICVLNALFPEAVPEAWQRCERYLSHVLTCAASFSGQTQDLAEVLGKAADYLRGRAQYEQAEPLYQRSLRIWEQTSGLASSQMATVLNGLAKLYTEQGKYEQAEPLFQQALRIQEQVLGPEHPLVAATVNTLGNLYTEQGKYEQAEALYQQVQHIREQVLGPEHPKVADMLNNLAILYTMQGKYKEAEALYQHVRHIREQVLGPEHPKVADVFNNLALLYTMQGKYEQAEPLFQQTLRIREQVLGPEHPHVADALNNLAILYTKQRKYEQAECLFQRVQRIQEQTLGSEHPKVAAALNNLADLFYEQGKYEQAEPLFQSARRIWEQTLGPEHPHVASALNGLANLFRQQGKYKEAEPLYQQALTLQEQHPGPHHPETARSLAGLALLYERVGNDVQADLLYKRACTIFEQGLGQKHPESAKTRKNYQSFLERRRRAAERQVPVSVDTSV